MDSHSGLEPFLSDFFDNGKHYIINYVLGIFSLILTFRLQMQVLVTKMMSCKFEFSLVDLSERIIFAEYSMSC